MPLGTHRFQRAASAKDLLIESDAPEPEGLGVQA